MKPSTGAVILATVTLIFVLAVSDPVQKGVFTVVMAIYIATMLICLAIERGQK